VYGLTSRTDVPQNKIDPINALYQKYVQKHPNKLKYGYVVNSDTANFDDNYSYKMIYVIKNLIRGINKIL